MRNYNFVQVLTSEEVIEVCRDNDYYTRGDCEDYSNLLDMCGYVTEESLEIIANDIKNHSVTEDSVFDIMRILAQHIHTNVAPIRKSNIARRKIG